MPRHINYRCYILLVACIFFSSCATTSEGRKQLSLVSDDRAARDGKRAFERIKNRNLLSNDPADNKYVSCVAKALASDNWDIVILQDDQANAFAFPGNKIAVNSGLLRVTVNQDQLATAIAHEIAHIHANHSAERTSQQIVLEAVSQVSKITSRNSSSLSKGVGLALNAGAVVVQLGLLYPFSRIQEEEADLKGLELMASAGFDPNEALPFWKNMEVYGAGGTEGPLSTHPTHQARIKTLEKRIAARSWQDTPPSLAGISRPTCDRDRL